MRWSLVALIVLLVAGGLYAADRSGALGLSEDEAMSGLYRIMLLAFIGGSIVVSYQGRGMQALKHAVAWLGIALFLVVGYSYRDVLQAAGQRVQGELMPAAPVTTRPGVVTLTKSRDGHFYADARVNGSQVNFLVDTGATTIALTLNDARNAGIDVAALSFSNPVSTANGTTMHASVRLGSIKIGDIELRDVRASVANDGLDQSLLGMSFLGRLNSYEFQRDRLTLRR